MLIGMVAVSEPENRMGSVTSMDLTERKQTEKTWTG